MFEQPERFAGQRIELASVEATGAEVAAALSSALGREIRYVEVPLDTIRESGDEDAVKMLEFFRQRGYSVDIESLLATYPEVRWHSVDEWARDHDWSALRQSG